MSTSVLGVMPHLLIASPPLSSIIVACTIVLVCSLFLLIFRHVKSKPLPSKAPPAKLDAAADSKPKAYLLFGTQTGTAERFCKSLRTNLSQRYGHSMDFEVLDMETFDAPARLPKEKLLFFIAATYGDGEPTDNAAAIYSHLVDSAQAVTDGDAEPSLQNLHFAVFGLGNKQYEHFCAVGKRFESALLQLGARQLVRRGDGDDDDDIDADFASWCEDLFAAMDASDLVKKQAPAAPPKAADIPAYTVRVLPPTAKHAADVTGCGTDAASPFPARVLTARDLYTPDAGRRCVHVELDITGSGIRYTAGDHIAVLPENQPAVVARAAKLLGVLPDDLVVLSAQGQLSAPPPGPLTVARLLTHHVDLTGPVHREQLEALAAFAEDADQAARLRRLASLEHKDEFHAYVVEARRNVLDVMEDHGSARPPLGAFVASVTHRLQPRFYSIASSPAAHPTAVHITCAVTDELTPAGAHGCPVNPQPHKPHAGRRHEGVASTYLATRHAGDMVPVYVRASHFRLPTNNAPVVMVGPGTGLAPFRGFLQEREAVLANGGTLAPAHLYFGCRHRAHDFLYEAELRAWLASGVLTALHVAFSRDGTSKDYVQHHMLRQAPELWQALNGGAYLYVCGDAKHMARDVHHALHEVAQRAGCTGSEAEAFVKALADGNRYQRDVW